MRDIAARTPSIGDTAVVGDDASLFQRRAPAFAAMGALYFAAVATPLYATMHTGSNVGVWPAAGVGFAACLLAPSRWRWQMALWIALVNLLALFLISTEPVLVRLQLAGIHVIEEWGGAELLILGLRRVPRLDRSADLIASAAVGALIVLVGAFLGDWVYGWHANGFDKLRLLQWWAPEAVAMLIFAPAVWHGYQTFASGRFGHREDLAERVVHVVLFAVLLTLVALVPFSIGTLPVGLVAVPFLLWAAIRLGPGMTTFDTVVLASILVAASYERRGPFGATDGSNFTRILWAHGYVLIVGVSNQVLGATIAEGRRGQRALHTAIDELRRGTARMAAFFGTSSELVLLVDEAGRLEAVTPAARALMTDAGVQLHAGRAVGAIVSSGGAKRDDPWPEVLRGERIRMTRALAGGEYELTFTPLAAPDGRVVGAVMLATDVSRLRDEAARASRSQRLESIGRLAGGVAHDFNNILTAILGQVALIEEELPQDSPLRADMREVARDVHRAAGLTRQLLAYARQQVIAPSLVDVNEVIRGLDGLLRRSISENVVIELRLAERLPPVLIDRGQLEQVIVNLVVNARDAMPAGGYLAIESRLEAVDAVRATVLEVTRGEHVAIRVSDTGVGIAPDVLPNIFEPFFSTKGPGAGTGLGLATVDGIVRQAGGAIDVTSSEGIGTSFRVVLPRAEGVPAPLAAESPARLAPDGRRETILVCEDDPAVRAVVVRALERHDFRVLAFAESDAALAHVRREAPEVALLVTDVVMPEMAGPELATALRELVPGLRVLYISGYAEAMLSTHGVLDDGIELLVKPFTPDTLVQRVRAAIA